MSQNNHDKKIADISIVLCGGAGQGIQTVEQLLTRMLKLSGFYVFATKEYMSRVRGGSNSTQIRVSDQPVEAPIRRIDILIPLDQDAIPHLSDRLDKDTVIIGDQEKLDTKQKIIDVSFVKMAKEIGHAIYANTIAAGLLLCLVEGDLEEGQAYLRDYFSAKGKKDVIPDNIKALQKGYEQAKRLMKEKEITPDRLTHLKKVKKVKNDLLVNGAEAIGFGALAGGCNFISSYPMSPSTGVLVFLSTYAQDFDIISEQAEDEISAINMAIGAWYAGARAMVTTSGGGLALMSEGISLAGMLESPVVIHLAQRPGPATGLPTRTEQADLQLALHAGHGEFPRILLAPANLQDAYELTRKAFYWADKFQVPVFILTDQYMMDSYYNSQMFQSPEEKIKRFIIETDADYQRYRLDTQDGISPRGIPGNGEGLVRLDSDEHDENGFITEDMDMRIKMMEKRMEKFSPIKKEILEPELIGPEDYDILCIGWGSTFPIISEALNRLNSRFNLSKVALLHFKQVYPISEKSTDYLKKAKHLICIENNYSGQFTQLLQLATGIKIGEKILKYNGLAFYADELADQLEKKISEMGGQK